MTLSAKPILLVAGHYGSGKTNLAINLALEYKKSGGPVTIIDLDIVNPYFRTADFRSELEEKGVRVIAPIFANTNLDLPALPPEIQAALEGKGTTVIDVGGDDAGAIALGQFARRITAVGYEFYYVVHARRYLTRTAETAAALLPEIEAASRLRATAIVNNTNLGPLTTRETVEASLPYAGEIGRLTGLSVAFTSIDRRLWRPGDNYFGIELPVGTSRTGAFPS